MGTLVTTELLNVIVKMKKMDSSFQQQADAPPSYEDVIKNPYHPSAPISSAPTTVQVMQVPSFDLGSKAARMICPNCQHSVTWGLHRSLASPHGLSALFFASRCSGPVSASHSVLTVFTMSNILAQTAKWCSVDTVGWEWTNNAYMGFVNLLLCRIFLESLLFFCIKKNIDVLIQK